MKLDYLANHTGAIATIAKWYVDEWGHLPGVSSMAQAEDNLRAYLNTDKIPLMIIAKEGDEILGAAQLKYREMDIYPEKEHWLGGVYVAKEHRGKGIAEKIILEIIRQAQRLGVHTLHLQTENLTGGLYRRMGWRPVEQVHFDGRDVLVMEKSIAPSL